MKALSADEHTRLDTLMRLMEPINQASEPEYRAALDACDGIFLNFPALANYVAMKKATMGTGKEPYEAGATVADLTLGMPRSPFDAGWDPSEEPDQRILEYLHDTAIPGYTEEQERHRARAFAAAVFEGQWFSNRKRRKWMKG